MTSQAPASPPGTAADVLGGREQRAIYRALLVDNPRFRNLFAAMLTSSLGDWIGLFAIIILTESLQGGTRAAAFALSGIMIARVLPTMLFGPVAGVFVDRWDRKRTLIVTDLGRGAVMILVALVGDVFQLAVATFLIEVMSTLFIPAKDAMLPNLVDREELVEANQVSLMVTYGTLPLGAGACALLVSAGNAFFGDVAVVGDRPVALAIWVNAVSFFLSAWFITRIAVGPAPRRRDVATEVGTPPGAWTELKQGFSFIANQPLIRALVVGVMAAFVAAGVVVGVGKLFTTHVNAGDSGFAVLGAVVGAGLFAGIFSAGPLARRWAKERLFPPGVAVAGLALIATALAPRLDLATLPALVMGAGAGLSFVTGYTLLQERSTDEIRGRTFAAFNSGVRAALSAALVLGPFLAGVIGYRSRPMLDGTFPYEIDGIRISLMLAGAVAFAGAVWTGRSMHQVVADGRESVLPAAFDAPRRSGLFVVFEGGEGAGKSTQIGRLRAALEDDGADVVMTRQPGGTPLGDLIRRILLDPASAALTDRAEALLFAADRAQHADELIRPALQRGAVVLCDRYVDSSIVYQGVARGLGQAEVEQLNRWGTEDLRPDLVVLLDVDPDEGLRRAGTEPDRLEAGGLPFHRTVNEAFRLRATTDPVRYLVLDASRPVDDLHAEILAAVRRHLAADTPAPAPAEART